MNKVEPLNEDLFKKIETLHIQLSKEEESIIERIDYILRRFFEIYGAHLECWWFDGAEEGEIGDFWKNHNSGIIFSITTNGVGTPNCELDSFSFIDRFGKTFEYEGYLPSRWLFENFEEEVIEGKKKYKEMLDAEKFKSKEKDKKNKELIKSAKSKLTKEEIKALRLK